VNAELATPSELFRQRPRYRPRSGQPTIAVSTRITDDFLSRMTKYGNRHELSLSETLRRLLERGLDA